MISWVLDVLIQKPKTCRSKTRPDLIRLMKHRTDLRSGLVGPLVIFWIINTWPTPLNLFIHSINSSLKPVSAGLSNTILLQHVWRHKNYSETRKSLACCHTGRICAQSTFSGFSDPGDEAPVFLKWSVRRRYFNMWYTADVCFPSGLWHGDVIS